MIAMVYSNYYSWVSNMLRESGRFDQVIHRFAFDLPDFADVYWLPVGHAHRLLDLGYDFAPEFPYASWWTQYSFQHCCMPDEVPDSGPVFGKVGDFKHQTLDAQAYPSGQDFRDALIRNNVRESPVVVSEIVNFTEEARFFVANGEITTGSWYRTWRGDWDGLYEQPFWLQDAKWYAQAQIDLIGSGQPNGYSIDVGFADEWKIVECNPTWASNPYGSEAKGFADSLIASFQPGESAWFPDLYTDL